MSGYSTCPNVPEHIVSDLAKRVAMRKGGLLPAAAATLLPCMDAGACTRRRRGRLATFAL